VAAEYTQAKPVAQRWLLTGDGSPLTPKTIPRRRGRRPTGPCAPGSWEPAGSRHEPDRQSAIEAGAIDLKLVGERIQELHEERENVRRELNNYQTPKAIPDTIQHPDNVRVIQGYLKGLFLARDSGIAKRHVRYLVDEIVINGTDVHIRGNTTAVLNTLAQKNNVRTGCLPVLTLGHDWLRGQDSNAAVSGISASLRPVSGRTGRATGGVNGPPRRLPVVGPLETGEFHVS